MRCSGHQRDRQGAASDHATSTRREAVAGRARHLTHENIGDVEAGQVLRRAAAGLDRRSSRCRTRDRARRPDRRAWWWPTRFEAAREAAYKVRVDYDAETAQRDLRVARRDRGRTPARPTSGHKDPPQAGDAEAAFAVGRRSSSRPSIGRRPQHHNPIELFTTTCVWNGDELTIYEPSQFVYGLQERRRASSSASTRARSAWSARSSAAPSARRAQ